MSGLAHLIEKITHNFDGSSRDSMSRLIPLMRGIKRPICGTLNKYFVGATDLFGRLKNIVNPFDPGPLGSMK